MVKLLAGCIELFQLLAAALCQDGVAQVAIGGDHLFSVIGHVVAIVAPETTVGNLVANVIWMNPPIGLHFRKKILPINMLGLGHDAFNARICPAPR